jgi:hypothetical protein
MEYVAVGLWCFTIGFVIGAALVRHLTKKIDVVGNDIEKAVTDLKA